MKNLILILIAVTLSSLSVNAQNALPNKYTINVPGYTNGITLPAEHVVEFREIYTHSIDTSGWIMEVGSITYTDTSYAHTVVNDSIPDRLIFNVNKAYADSSLRDNFNPLKYLLDAKYGAGNYTETP